MPPTRRNDAPDMTDTRTAPRSLFQVLKSPPTTSALVGGSAEGVGSPSHALRVAQARTRDTCARYPRDNMPDCRWTLIT